MSAANDEGEEVLPMDQTILALDAQLAAMDEDVRADREDESRRRHLPAPNAPSGYVLPDLEALVAEIGASYPLLAYVVQTDEEFDEASALDPVILAGLVSP